MDKNSIIGFVLIGVIFFGFTWYQSNQYQKQREYQAQLDSIAYAEQAALMAEQDCALLQMRQKGGDLDEIYQKYFEKAGDTHDQGPDAEKRGTAAKLLQKLRRR